jgi:hypothetical protein
VNQEWNISTRSHVCSESETPFEDGTEIVSRLFFGPEGYQRQDFAAAAWRAALREDSVSVWKSVYRAPPPLPEEPVKKETVESLLRDLMESENPSQERVIYILAVMLERKRVLVERVVNRADDGKITRLFEHRKTGESFLIPDPELKLSEIEEVQREVAERLGLNKDEG